jgi:two-component system sensor histidine kinase/response regulator
MSLRVRALIVFLASVILIAGLIATVAAFEAVSARTQVYSEETTSAIIAAQYLLRDVIDAETGVRGYIATRQSVFLQPYQAALGESSDAMRELGAAVKTGILPVTSGREINQRAIRVLEILQQEVSMVARHDRDAALRNLRTGTEKRQMDALRSAIGVQVRRWSADRAKAAASLRRLRDIDFGVTLAGSLAVIGGLMPSLWFFGFGLIRRIDALCENTARIADAQPLLEPLPGNDELAKLDRGLRAMSRVIAERESIMGRFRLIFDVAQDAIIFIDAESGRVVEANAAACHLYGYDHEELIGLAAATLRPPQYRDTLEKLFAEASAGGVTTEAVALRKDGSTFPIEASLRGAIVGEQRLAVAVIRDASERQQARKQLLGALDDAVRSSRLKGEFVATMSHELRTAMNGVLGMADLLLQTSSDPQQHDYAETIRDSADALLRILNDILDISKIEAGKVEIESAAFDIRRVVESAATILGPSAAHKPIGLMTFIDPRLPSLVNGDGGRLRQVLLNLIGNAIKFTSRGAVSLTVEPAGNELVRFCVADTGTGMSPETIEKLFKPFTQADSSTTRRYGGTGLGLSISRGLVELMGGTLEVTSQIGIGSRFWFTIPLPELSGGDGVIALSGRRCAIVVTDEATRTMLERYANSWQMQSVSADSWIAPGFVGAFDVAIVDANNRATAENHDVARIVSVIDGDGPASALRSGNTIVRAPLTQSAVYEALDEAFAATRKPLDFPEPQPPLGLRVLVAEDNAINQRVARKQLERLGCSVIIASTGREALERFQDHQFDLVLMDCHMPEMDGYTAAQRIRESEAGRSERIPIIALTASAMQETRTRCIAAGMDDLLSKPIPLNALRTALSRWVPKETSL